jgi:2-dehydro-3-deoxygalactonokinase
VNTAALIGIDWGTSQLRAFRISSSGQILERRQSAQGIAGLRHAQFDDALGALISDWQSKTQAVPILMCGMIGSRQGWREAPYGDCPAELSTLLDTLQPIDTRCGPALLVGGLSTQEGNPYRDVMRGEETQIFGAVASTDRHLCVTPGTHSKWATVDGRRIERFRTYMTGELYGLLCRHSSLGWLMENAGEQPHDEDSFLAGVRLALQDAQLLHSLFSVRTRGLFQQQPPGALAAYLSGLLIGSEIAAETRQGAPCPILIIASSQLASLYRAALAAAGRTDVHWVDAGEAVARGLGKLWQLHRQEI